MLASLPRPCSQIEICRGVIDHVIVLRTLLVCHPGFLVLENFASPEEVQRLRSRAETLVDGFNPESVSIFSTKSQVTTTPALSWLVCLTLSGLLKRGRFQSRLRATNYMT